MGGRGGRPGWQAIICWEKKTSFFPSSPSHTTNHRGGTRSGSSSLPCSLARWWENNRRNVIKTQDHLEHVPTKKMLRIGFAIYLVVKTKWGKKRKITLKMYKVHVTASSKWPLDSQKLRSRFKPCWEGHLWVQTGSPWRTSVENGCSIYLVQERWIRLMNKWGELPTPHPLFCVAGGLDLPKTSF